MKELRIGFVLYGGVSLAVYMNGITTELWHLLRASRRRQDGEKNACDGLGDTTVIYAELLDELRDLCKKDLRVVVDVIAGTSAGGLNGAMLAKAIVNGGDLRHISRMWIEDADISRLRATPPKKMPRRYRVVLWVAARCFPKVCQIKNFVSGTKGLKKLGWQWLCDHVYSMLKQTDGTSTILNGHYFTEMAARAFADIRSDGRALLPECASFDLFMTQTDIHGWPRHLPVSEAFHDKPLYELTPRPRHAFPSAATGRKVER